MAMLVPEQLKDLTERRSILINHLLRHGYDVDTNGLTSTDKSLKKQASLKGDNKYELYNKSNKIKNITEILTNNQILKEINLESDKIEIGKKFILQLDNSNDKKEFILVDKILDLDSNNYISTNDYLGKQLFQKKENDKFSLDISTFLGHTNIEGKIVSIIKDSDKYLSFLRSKNNTYVNEITHSQKDLLLDEKLRLSNKLTELSDVDKIRIKFINILLKNATIKESNASFIDVGTIFDIEFFHQKTQQYELINKAVSDELSDSYIEKDSELGSRIIGLSNNDYFSFETDKGTIDGKVKIHTLLNLKR